MAIKTAPSGSLAWWALGAQARRVAGMLSPQDAQIAEAFAAECEDEARAASLKSLHHSRSAFVQRPYAHSIAQLEDLHRNKSTFARISGDGRDGAGVQVLAPNRAVIVLAQVVGIIARQSNPSPEAACGTSEGHPLPCRGDATRRAQLRASKSQPQHRSKGKVAQQSGRATSDHKKTSHYGPTSRRVAVKFPARPPPVRNHDLEKPDFEPANRALHRLRPGSRQAADGCVTISQGHFAKNALFSDSGPRKQ